MKAALDRIGSSWWLVLILGVVTVIVGVIVFLHPFAAVRVAAVILGIWLLISGVFQLLQSFDRSLEPAARSLSAISGVLGIILGIICFESVENRLELLVLFIGLWWIIRGVMQLVVGAGAGEGGGFLIFLGILGVVAGIVVLIWNIASLAVLALVVGIWLLVLGVAEIISAFRVRALHKKAEAAAAGG